MKLNMKTVPALVQDEPDVLTNILLMFNIHALREQWDLLTVALKLRETIELLSEKFEKKPTENDLVTATGLPKATIRRSKLLLELPEKYIKMMLTELEKPKPQQKLTEDFFIEMERALKTVDRAMPDLIESKDDTRDVLIKKFKSGVIENRVHFRNVARMARAENVDADKDLARSSLANLFSDNKVSIAEAYESSVAEAYAERDVITRLSGLVERLKSFPPEEVDDEVGEWLREVVKHAQRLLGRI
jgi:hypothetical protein